MLDLLETVLLGVGSFFFGRSIMKAIMKEWKMVAIAGLISSTSYFILHMMIMIRQIK